MSGEGSSGKKGVSVKSHVRQTILHVRDFFQKENENGGPTIPVNNVVKRTAAAVQVSERTVKRVTQEKNVKPDSSDPRLVTPGKCRPHRRPITSLDSFQEDAIRRHIHSYYERKIYPTRKRLLVSLKEAELFQGEKTSLTLILQNLGFKWKKFAGNRKLLLERSDIVAWRGRFLREVVNLNVNDIVWLDETWINSGDSKTHAWTDDTSAGCMNTPIGKGSRLILLQAGSIRGFVPNSKLLFIGKKNTGDYHNERNQNSFEEWFENKLLPNIPPKQCIIMDNAPYNSVQLETFPNIGWKKDDIIKWLTERNIRFNPNMYKQELLEIAKFNKPQFPSYRVEHLAEKYGHKVIRLPPYHYHFNPFELIWAQIEGYVADENGTFKISDVMKLVNEKIELIGPAEWEKCIGHVEKLMKSQAKLDEVVERKLEEIIISLTNSSSSSRDSDLDDDESDNEDEMIGDLDYMEGMFPLS